MSAPRRYRSVAEMPGTIPIFPLTGVLLLPQARLPLNVFEPRYLALVDDAMSDGRLIGMIQPTTPGDDMALRPPLAEVGCAGRIIEYSETDDGRYVITLAGIVRFRVAAEEEATTPYRQVVADYSAFANDFQSDDTEIARERLLSALKPYLSEREMKTDWNALYEAPADMLVNALAMLCPFEPAEKQALLEAPHLSDRAQTLIALIEMANAGSASGGGETSTPVH